jgi:hypothetical protein
VGPGHKNITDALLWQLDFVPQKGDEALEAQFKTLLKPYHTESLFPDCTLRPSIYPIPLPASISALITLSIDLSELLQHFQCEWEADQEWYEALVQGDPNFVTENGMVFHKGCLFVPKPL